MNFNVASNYSSEGPDEVIYLSGVGASDGIGNADTVYTNLVNRLVDREQVDEVRSERVLRREANFNPLGLDKVDHLDRSLGDVRHILSVRELAQE